MTTSSSPYLTSCQRGTQNAYASSAAACAASSAARAVSSYVIQTGRQICRVVSCIGIEIRTAACKPRRVFRKETPCQWVVVSGPFNGRSRRPARPTRPPAIKINDSASNERNENKPLKNPDYKIENPYSDNLLQIS